LVSGIAHGLFNAGVSVCLDATAGSFVAEASLVDTRVGVPGIIIGLFNAGVCRDATAGSFDAAVVNTQVGVSDIVRGLFIG
jgi:hypothetical protein